MNNPAFVRVRNGVANLQHDTQEPLQELRIAVVLVKLGDQLLQRIAAHQLHGEVGLFAAGGHPHVVNRDDVGMLELTGNLGFLDKYHGPPGLRRVGLQHFGRHGTTHPFIPGRSDGSHATATQLAFIFVAQRARGLELGLGGKGRSGFQDWLGLLALFNDLHAGRHHDGHRLGRQLGTRHDHRLLRFR